MYLARQWYKLSWQAIAGSNPVHSLSAHNLHERIIAPILAIDDPRAAASKRIDFIGGVHGEQELERRVEQNSVDTDNSSQQAVAFSLPAVQMRQLLTIADQGRIMPPKSTWFEPKLRSGFAVNLIRSTIK